MALCQLFLFFVVCPLLQRCLLHLLPEGDEMRQVDEILALPGEELATLPVQHALRAHEVALNRLRSGLDREMQVGGGVDKVFEIWRVSACNRAPHISLWAQGVHEKLNQAQQELKGVLDALEPLLLVLNGGQPPLFDTSDAGQRWLFWTFGFLGLLFPSDTRTVSSAFFN